MDVDKYKAFNQGRKSIEVFTLQSSKMEYIENDAATREKSEDHSDYIIQFGTTIPGSF